MGKDRVTIAIPKELYEKIKAEIDGTGFSSPSEWIKYVLRQTLSAAQTTQDKSLISFPYLTGDKE